MMLYAAFAWPLLESTQPGFKKHSPGVLVWLFRATGLAADSAHVHLIITAALRWYPETILT